MPESIFKASIRSFFIALFSVAGILFGILLIFALIGSLSTAIDGSPEITYSYTPEVKPNAEGIRKLEKDTAPVVLKVNINGVIGLDSLTRKAIAQQLIESRERALEDDRVAAILLCIDCPGGTVIDSDGIYREIKAYKERHKVPVYAYIDGFSASGGYYIAAAADKIFASHASLIGSIGVLLPSVMNFSQLMEKVGVQALTLYDGKGKDNLNPFRPWKEGEETNIQDIIDFYYEMFLDIVTAARPIDRKKLVDEYGANIYPAPVAKQLGYIDETGYTLNQTLKLLTEKIGITDNHYQVLELDNKNWFSELFRNHSTMLTGKITHQIDLAPEMRPELSNQLLYLYRP